MKKLTLFSFKNSAIVGEFSNSIFYSNDLEVLIKTYKEDDVIYETGTISKLYVIMAGGMKFDNEIVSKGEIVLFDKDEFFEIKFIDKSTVIVISSKKNDKDFKILRGSDQS